MIHSDEAKHRSVDLRIFSQWLIYLVDLAVDNLITLVFHFPTDAVSFETKSPITSLGCDYSKESFLKTLRGIVSKETVCCVGGKVKH